MKQYRIDTNNYLPDAECTLSPDDPIHDMIAAQYMGGLNAAARLNERKAQISAETDELKAPILQYANTYGVKPGSPAWYALNGTTTTRTRGKK
jgi:hypothetical protein